MTRSRTTSPRQAAANRRNAAKSTGPRTPQGKAWSRRNALKHGILASQAVIATLEGRAGRKLFEAMVDGLNLDFSPVGTYEQLLVQEIAACFWRKRRLLMFENRAAFDVQEQNVTKFLAGGLEGIAQRPAPYLLDSKLALADDVYRVAGLDGLTLPSEADVNRVMRYEAAINRTRDRAVANLQTMRKARSLEQKRTGATGHAAASRAEAAVIVDREAARRNARNDRLHRFPALAAVRIWDAFTDAQQDLNREKEAQSAAPENDQTKPNNPTELSLDERVQRALRESFARTYEPQASPEASATAPADPDKPPTT